MVSLAGPLRAAQVSRRQSCLPCHLSFATLRYSSAILARPCSPRRAACWNRKRRRQEKEQARQRGQGQYPVASLYVFTTGKGIMMMKKNVTELQSSSVGGAALGGVSVSSSVYLTPPAIREGSNEEGEEKEGEEAIFEAPAPAVEEHQSAAGGTAAAEERTPTGGTGAGGEALPAGWGAVWDPNYQQYCEYPLSSSVLSPRTNRRRNRASTASSAHARRCQLASCSFWYLTPRCC